MLNVGEDSFGALGLDFDGVNFDEVVWEGDTDLDIVAGHFGVLHQGGVDSVG